MSRTTAQSARCSFALLGVTLSFAMLNSQSIFAASAQGMTAESGAAPSVGATHPVASSLSNGKAVPARVTFAQTQIAEFRYGTPRMGSTPRLPIPPPHRMRFESII